MGETARPDHVQSTSHQEVQDEGGDGGLGVYDLEHHRQQGTPLQQRGLGIFRVFTTSLFSLTTQSQISEELVQQLSRGAEDQNRGEKRNLGPERFVQMI